MNVQFMRLFSERPDLRHHHKPWVKYTGPAICDVTDDYDRCPMTKEPLLRE